MCNMEAPSLITAIIFQILNQMWITMKNLFRLILFSHLKNLNLFNMLKAKPFVNRYIV
jgi:hypothetical protein